MRVGVTLLPSNYSDWPYFETAGPNEAARVPDAQVYEEDLRLGELIEPLGFDSIWTVEHHFSPLTMVPNPVQFLTYFAGCTKRVDFGTMVVVLPWHDPVRVAEELSMLDNMLRGRRLIIGLGRGAGRREFDGLRVPMSESRARFLEGLDILRLALSQERFSYRGQYYTIPETTIRPRPRSDLVAGMGMAWMSNETLPIAANAGVGMLMANQKSWDAYREDIQQFNVVRAQHGWDPVQPSVLVNVCCAGTEDEAWSIMRRHWTEQQQSITRHYEFTDAAHFRDVGGYEFYEKIARTHERMTAEQISEASARPQAWGTGAQVIAKLKHIQEMTRAGDLILCFRYGGMPVEVAEQNMRMFADEVLPALQAWDGVAATG